MHISCRHKINEVAGPVGARDLLQCIDVFAGTAKIFNAFSESVFPSAKYDVLFDPEAQDINTDAGVVLLLVWLRRLAPGSSITHWGTLCKTWIWLSRNSTGRGEHAVLGNEQFEKVRTNEVIFIHLEPPRSSLERLSGISFFERF